MYNHVFSIINPNTILKSNLRLRKYVETCLPFVVALKVASCFHIGHVLISGALLLKHHRNCKMYKLQYEG